jgi:hypothetical protein
MPNNNVRYQQSIAAEFIALKDRVRFFIEDNHWGEDGRYKEIILMNFLRRVLPDNIAVGTGFVKNNYNQLTDQIDIIVYKKNDPKLFSEGDFVILMPESVLGIVEVKSKVNSQILCNRNQHGREILSTIDKCHRNGEIIGRNNIFNGIFSYEKQISFEGRRISDLFVGQLKEKYGYINHICFDQIFLCVIGLIVFMTYRIKKSLVNLLRIIRVLHLATLYQIYSKRYIDFSFQRF